MGGRRPHRAIALSWLSTARASAGDAHMTLMQPMRCPYSPMFFAYDWLHPTRWPSSTNVRIAAASRAQSPVAKPWYAMSKKAKWRLRFIAAEMVRHCAGVGSTPVGLCAHACSRKNDPAGAASMSASSPSRSRPSVFGSSARRSPRGGERRRSQVAVAS